MGIYLPEGSPLDNTSWSGSVSAMPSDQVPDPPSSLEALVLGRDGVQLVFNWPARDGGKVISSFVVVYDTMEDFSLANEMNISPSLPEKIPNNSDKFVFDFVPASPQLNSGSTYFIKLIAVNDVGKSTAS